MKERAGAEDVTAAAAWLLPFLALDAVLFFWMPPTDAQREAADPLVQLVSAWGPPWLYLPVALAVGLAWATRYRRRPSAAAFRRAGLAALAGAVVALALAVGASIALGSTLPGFVPPEEGAAPGVTLGLAAGAIEETVFRLGVLALSYLACRRRLGVLASTAIASGLTAVAFALAHELGPAGGQWELGPLTTRLLVPGLLMSVVFLRVSPAFLVTAHLTAHLALPLLFE